MVGDGGARAAAARRRAADLGARTAALAAGIADTEDQAAELYDRLARDRPHDAPRLRGLAEHARTFAEKERAYARDHAASPGSGSEPVHGRRNS